MTKTKGKHRVLKVTPFFRKCLRKAKFETMEEAETKIREMFNSPTHRDRRGILQAYPCKFCTKYHIGHRKFMKGGFY